MIATAGTALARRNEIHGFARPPSTAMRDTAKQAVSQSAMSLVGGMDATAKSVSAMRHKNRHRHRC
jgi:hypothetical protein